MENIFALIVSDGRISPILFHKVDNFILDIFGEFLLPSNHVNQDCSAKIIFDVDVNFALYPCQMVHNPLVTLEDRHSQRRDSPGVLSIHMGSSLDEDLHTEPPAIGTGIVEVAVVRGVQSVRVSSQSEKI